jgi:HAD superfamily hydrolase (TIGR01549 family)
MSGKFRVLSLDLGETTIWDTKEIGAAGYAIRVRVLTRAFVGSDGTLLPEEEVARVRDGLLSEWKREGRFARCFTIRHQIEEIMRRLHARVAKPIEELAEEYSRAGLREHPPYINPEAQELVKELNGAAFPVIAISNTARTSRTWKSFFEEVGGMRFDHVVSSTDLGTCKPDSRMFLEASRLTGVEPSKILHVGDRMNTDVEGALKCGMGAALYCGLWPRYYDMAEGPAVRPPKGSPIPCFDNLREVRKLLELPRVQRPKA